MAVRRKSVPLSLASSILAHTASLLLWSQGADGKCLINSAETLLQGGSADPEVIGRIIQPARSNNTLSSAVCLGQTTYTPLEPAVPIRSRHHIAPSQINKEVRYFRHPIQSPSSGGLRSLSVSLLRYPFFSNAITYVT